MLFIHDHTFVKKSDNYYTTGSLNQRVMNRYKEWFGNVQVFATTRTATEKDSAFIRDENLVQNLEFKLVPKKNSILHIIKCCKPLKAAVRTSDCVVIRMSILGALGVFYAKKFNRPYLVEMVACPWDSLWYHSKKGKVLAPVMVLLTKYICKRAPYVLYVTNEFLQKRYPTKGKSIGCSDVELIDVNTTALEERINKINDIDLKSNIIRLCTVANISVKYKGQDLVIGAIKELSTRGLNCEYSLIGGGDPTRLKEYSKECGVEDNIHFVGPVPHEKIFEYLDSIDIYVQPSYQEGLPRAVIEAMSRGCPVIGASTGGIPELIDKQCVFQKGSQDNLINVLLQVDKESMKKNALKNFEKSKLYEKDYLDKLRAEFYMDFIIHVKKG